MEGVIGYTTMFAGTCSQKLGFCQGQIINIAQNTALFSILGTTYGGNGTTTFALPNLIGRNVVGAGTGPGLSSYKLGQVGGSQTVTLTLGQMPAHVHPIQVTATPQGFDDTGTTSSPDGVYAISGSTGYSGSSNVNMATYPVTVQTSVAGSDIPYGIMPAYMALNYVICMYGVFPARN